MEQRTARQREWDRQYGEDNWQVGYIIDGAFVSQEEALLAVDTSVCDRGAMS
jgi:hypothetical protein